MSYEPCLNVKVSEEENLDARKRIKRIREQRMQSNRCRNTGEKADKDRKWKVKHDT